MSRNRSLKELWELVRDYVGENGFVSYSGICNVLIEMYNQGLISMDEYVELVFDLKANKPSFELHKHKDFYIDERYTGFMFWWENSKKGDEQRVKFIERLVSVHSEKEKEGIGDDKNNRPEKKGGFRELLKGLSGL